MKKAFFLFAISFLSCAAFSQTETFTLNQEKARYNESRNVSHTISSVFISETAITAANFHQIAAIMGQKDGYVSCTLNSQNELVVQHEDWLQVKDIIDVINEVVLVEHKNESPEKS